MSDKFNSSRKFFEINLSNIINDEIINNIADIQIDPEIINLNEKKKNNIRKPTAYKAIMKNYNKLLLEKYFMKLFKLSDIIIYYNQVYDPIYIMPMIPGGESTYIPEVGQEAYDYFNNDYENKNIIRLLDYNKDLGIFNLYNQQLSSIAIQIRFENKNRLLDVIELTLGTESSDIIDMVTKNNILLTKYNKKYLLSILESNLDISDEDIITDININDKSDKETHYLLKESEYKKLIECITEIFDLLSKQLKINLMLLFNKPDFDIQANHKYSNEVSSYVKSLTKINESESKSWPVYIQKYDSELKNYMIGVSIPGIIIRYLNFGSNKLKHYNTKQDVSKLFFECVTEINAKKDPSLFSYELTNSIQDSVNIFNIPVSIKTSNVEPYLQFDPEDKFHPLKVIQININQVPTNFLLGKSYNLYLDDDKDNDLVGKITKFNEENTVDIYWSENYLQNVGL